MISKKRHLESFTLIELLVVIAVVAVLSVVVILTLNPSELIKQARDSNRLADLSTINTALGLFSADVVGGFMGTSSVVYISVPSATSTCADLSLPGLPSGYSYNCVTSQNLRNIDGTGWIPVNFQRISSNSPVSQLPVDPVNSVSSLKIYAYIPNLNSKYKLSTAIESQKFSSRASEDTGTISSRYEIGEDTQLYGPELITNGTFDSDTSWTKEAGWSISGGTAVGAGTIAFIYQNVSVTSTRQYKTSMDVVSTGGPLDRVYINAQTIDYLWRFTGHYDYEFTSGYNGIQPYKIRGKGCCEGFSGTLDNVSLKEKVVY
jgi:prepilin-type N-terminal cleavage/methylation domain-containing protein